MKLWHMRLGHLSERGMTELHKRNLLHGVKTCKLDFCNFFVLGKQTRVSLMTGKHTTKGILDMCTKNIIIIIITYYCYYYYYYSYLLLLLLLLLLSPLSL